MMTLRQFAAKLETIPATTAWYLADLGEARGKQELFTKQSPQRLKILREHALIESAISSNRIEGVEVDQARIGTLQYKEKDSDIIEKYPDGRERVRFKTVPTTETTVHLQELIERWDDCLRERWVHPQLGTSYRTEQRSLLRDVGVEFPRLAGRQA